MTLTISAAKFAAALALAAKVATKKSTLPILANVLLRCNGTDRVQVSASDLTIQFTEELECEASGGEWTVSVDAQLLAEAAGSVPDGSVTVTALNGGDRLELVARSARFAFATLPSSDFPPLIAPGTSVQCATLPATLLARVLDETLYAASADITRYQLAGVHLYAEGGLLVAESSDGHMASLVRRAVHDVPDMSGGLIPRKGVADIVRAIAGADTVELGFSGAHCFARVGARHVAVALVDASFPPLRDHVRAKSRYGIICRRDELIHAIQRVAVMTGRAGDGEGLLFQSENGRLAVAARSASGEARDTIAAEHHGEAFEICASPALMLATLNHIDADTVAMGIETPKEPIHLRPVGDDGQVAIVMPMSIQ